MAIIEQLSETVARQGEEIAVLKDEINVLKKQKKRPSFKPSKLDESTDDETDGETEKDASAMNGLPGLKVQRAKVGSIFFHCFGLETWAIK